MPVADPEQVPSVRSGPAVDGDPARRVQPLDDTGDGARGEGQARPGSRVVAEDFGEHAEGQRVLLRDGVGDHGEGAQQARAEALAGGHRQPDESFRRRHGPDLSAGRRPVSAGKGSAPALR